MIWKLAACIWQVFVLILLLAVISCAVALVAVVYEAKHRAQFLPDAPVEGDE
jgi:cell division protein FtsL